MYACKDFLHAQALRSQTQSQTMRPDAAQDPDPHLCSGPATPPNAAHSHEMWPSMSPPWCLQPWLHRAAGWAQGSWHLPAGRLRVGGPTGDMGAKTPRAVSPPALRLPASFLLPSSKQALSHQHPHRVSVSWTPIALMAALQDRLSSTRGSNSSSQN